MAGIWGRQRFGIRRLDDDVRRRVFAGLGIERLLKIALAQRFSCFIWCRAGNIVRTFRPGLPDLHLLGAFGDDARQRRRSDQAMFSGVLSHGQAVRGEHEGSTGVDHFHGQRLDSAAARHRG